MASPNTKRQDRALHVMGLLNIWRSKQWLHDDDWKRLENLAHVLKTARRIEQIKSRDRLHIADEVARSTGFEPPAEPDAACIESDRQPRSPSGGAEASVLAMYTAMQEAAHISRMESALDGLKAGSERLAGAWAEISAAIPRPVSITHLKDGVVIGVGDNQLRLSVAEFKALVSRHALSTEWPLSGSAELQAVPERHSGCRFSEPGDSFAPISELSTEGRCTRCISTFSGRPRCP